MFGRFCLIVANGRMGNLQQTSLEGLAIFYCHA
jgi:hypothetical protein